MSGTGPDNPGASAGSPRLDPDPPEGGAPRFPPAGRAPATRPSPSWRPGVVEVQLRQRIEPDLAPAGPEASQEIRSAENADLTAFNRTLRRHELQRAELTFQTPPEQALEAQEAGQRQGMAIPNLMSFVTLYFPAGADTERIAGELNELPEVERAVPVPRAIPPQTPLNEPLVGNGDQVVVDPDTNLENQWYVFRCRGDRAWGISSGDGVVIADIDWGYRTGHEDLADRLDLTHAFNAFDGGTDVDHGDGISHGTAVMGLAGGADNDRGMAGLAFGASLWPIQANSGPGDFLGGDAWARAIEWVRTADSGGRRKVIILEVQTDTFGNYEMVPSVRAAIQTAIASGVVVCVAAGNGDRDAGVDDQGNVFPETGSILVGATEYDATENRRAGFSNFSPRIAVCAPGDTDHDLTCSSSADDTYRNGFGGTSGATPKVAATAALMLSVNPGLTHEQVKTILNQSGSAVVTDPDKPVGRFLDCEAAVLEAQRMAAVEASTSR
jgi:subtilisin family serine protease